jgi:hypothetical protein
MTATVVSLQSWQLVAPGDLDLLSVADKVQKFNLPTGFCVGGSYAGWLLQAREVLLQAK